MPTADEPPRFCRIEQQLGRAEPCPEAGCAFWEAAEGARPGFCVFERVDFAGRTELAEWLHTLREELGGASDESAAEARRRFYARLNAGRSD